MGVMMSRYLPGIGLGLALLALGPATSAFATLSESERMQMALLMKADPSVEMQVEFEADSADVKPGSLSALHRLGKALSDAALNDAVLMIGVHADAIDDPTSRSLAERRAETIKQFLVSNYKIDADRLVTSALRASPDRPNGVRIVNISKRPSEGDAPAK
jgi:hypothetical protein